MTQTRVSGGGGEFVYGGAIDLLQQEINEYIKYCKSKTVPECLAHVAKGAVFGRGGNGFGERREGLYGLTRELAFKNVGAVINMIISKGYAIKRRYSAPQSNLMDTKGVGGKMYRAKTRDGRQAQIRAMIAKGILQPVSSEEKKYIRKNKFGSYFQSYNKPSGYPRTDHSSPPEANRRYAVSRFLSIGWLPAKQGFGKSNGFDIDIKSLASVVGRYGYIVFYGSANNFKITIGNSTNGMHIVDKKHHIVERSLRNVASDTRDYINRKKQELKGKFKLIKTS